ALLLRKGARGAIELLGDGTDAAFTLNRLDQDGADVVRELSFEISCVVELHELETWYERLELLAILLLTCCRKSPANPAVERLIKRQDAKLGSRVRPREFQASFDGLRPAVRKEGTIKSRYAAQLLGESSLIFVIDEI